MTQTTKHTPGPWRVYEDATGDLICGPSDGFTDNIAHASHRLNSDERKANAVLIAAAPATAARLDSALAINKELVEAATAVEQAYGCECVEGEVVGHCPMCRLRAVLARAQEGKL